MLWLLAGILALGIGGAAALLLGLRGRRINDHPVCPKCRFDLHGVYPASKTCPECGRDLDRSRAVRIGERRRRPAVALIGALALLIALGATGAIGWGAATKYDWNEVKPVWLLGQELSSADPAVADAAMLQLVRRLDDGRLAPVRDGEPNTRAAERLARHILDIQADRDRPWNRRAGEMFERMWSLRLLPEKMVRTYIAQSSPVDIHIRRRIVRGQPLAIRFDIHQRAGGGDMIAVEGTLLDVFVDDERVEGGRFQFLVTQGLNWATRMTDDVQPLELAFLSDATFSPARMPQPEAPDIAPGPRRVRVRLLIACKEFTGAWGVGSGPWMMTRRRVPLPVMGQDASAEEIGAAIPPPRQIGPSGPEEEQAPGIILYRIVEIEQAVEVVEDPASAVAFRSGADAALLAERLAATATLESSWSTDPKVGPLRLQLSIANDLPLDCAFDISMILPGGEQREIGWFANDLRPEVTQHHPHRFPLGPLEGVSPGDRLRFVFTPSPAAAAHSAGIEEIAGEPFEVELIHPELEPPPQIINGQ